MKRWEQVRVTAYGQRRRRILKGKRDSALMIAGLIASAYAASAGQDSPFTQDSPDQRMKVN